MAKYSVLLVGRNKVMIGDFFTHLRDELECLSCTGRFEDVRNHLKYYKPDALVYCLMEDSYEDMQQILSVKSKLEEDDIPLVIIGQSEDCDEFCRYSANSAQLVIEKSMLSITQILARLNRFLDNRQTKAGRNRKTEQSQPGGASDPSKEDKLIEAARMLNLDMPPEMAEQLARPVKRHILVVDDNPMMLKVIRESLRDRYEVATAISGKIARKYLTNKSVDLILLDYEMPEESGSEVLEKLRQDESTKDIPVIFLTGVKEKTKIQKALSLKPQGYLLKPIEHDKLIEAIKNQFGEV
ncbi:MAG: response regulator [Butyrivibrio sp.]|nr:response regulator [Acetatifactor muris]MCM1559324.1 response regulator [Butyrivibrio sp.]